MLRIVLIIITVGLFAVAGVYVVQTFRTSGGLVKSAKDIAPTIHELNPNPPIIEMFQKEVLVTVTRDGFNPTEVRVKIYTEVIFQNDTEETIRVENIPAENKRKEITREILPGGQAVFEPYFKGEYPFHDAYHPERTGRVIVE